jgi:hypothetical protein
MIRPKDVERMSPLGFELAETGRELLAEEVA